MHFQKTTVFSAHPGRLEGATSFKGAKVQPGSYRSACSENDFELACCEFSSSMISLFFRVARRRFSPMEIGVHFKFAQLVNYAITKVSSPQLAK